MGDHVLFDLLQRDACDPLAAHFHDHVVPRDLLARQVILLNDSNEVVGLESLESLLDGYRPEWAVGQPLFEAEPQ